MVSHHPVTQFSSKMCSVVPLAPPRQNCINHGHADPLGYPTDTHRDDLMRKHYPSLERNIIVMGACSGLTSYIDPVYK